MEAQTFVVYGEEEEGKGENGRVKSRERARNRYGGGAGGMARGVVVAAAVDALSMTFRNVGSVVHADLAKKKNCKNVRAAKQTHASAPKVFRAHIENTNARACI